MMAKFYELHLSEHVEPPTALRRAQLWLRRASNLDLIAYARSATAQGRLDKSHVAGIAEELSEAGLRRPRKAPLVEWAEPEPPSVASRTGPAAKTTARAATPITRPYTHPYYWAGFIYTGL
jgi:CHAT domain-containing protein